MLDDSDKRRDEKRHRRRRARRHIVGIWMVLTVMLLSFFVGLSLLAISGRAIYAPDWAAEFAADRINARLTNGHVTVGQLVVQANEQGIPAVKMRNVGVFDAGGAAIAQLNELRMKVAFGPLLKGRLRPETLHLAGAQMTVRRKQDGTFDVSFGQGATTSGTLPGVLDALDAAFSEPPLKSITSLDASDLTITLEDARTGRLWQITDGTLRLGRTESGLDMTVAFDVFNGTEDLAETVIGIKTDTATSAASFGANFKNATAADIALQSPVLSFLGVLNAPISGAVRASFGDAGNLSDLAGTLQIAAGALQPTAQTPPVAFDSGKVYFDFDPQARKINFSEVSVGTAAASIAGQGHAYLRDFKDGWPSTMLVQLGLNKLTIRSRDLYSEPLTFSRGGVDFRMTLSPFKVEVGQVALADGDVRAVGKGAVQAGAEGWEASADISINHMSYERLMSLWPLPLVPNTRMWLINNFRSGRLSNITGVARIAPGKSPQLHLGYRIHDAEFRYIRTMPDVTDATGYATIDGKKMTVVLEKGVITAPEGGRVDMAGSTMTIPDITRKPARAELRLKGRAGTKAVLSLLNEPPFRILRTTSFGPDVADGSAQFVADVGFDLKKRILFPDVAYDVTGTLSDVVSDKLVPGKVLTGERLALKATPEMVEIFGPVRLGRVSADVRWQRPMDPTLGGISAVTGRVQLSQDFLDEFGIGLPEGSVSGAGTGDFRIDLSPGQAPHYELTSDVQGLGLAIEAIGWSKPADKAGNLRVVGHLGESPGVDDLSFSGPGLTASGGKVLLTAQGGLDKATFQRVQVGEWLDAPVVLVGRGPGRDPEVQVTGGTLDLRQTSFGSSGAGSDSPITLSLDKLRVSEGIVLTEFRGKFTDTAGLAGEFEARVNGGAKVAGQVSPDKFGTAVRARSDKAGRVLRDAGVFDTAVGGTLDLTLRPRQQEGTYRGALHIEQFRVKDAPALTELLSAVSIVGLLDQLSGPGISFAELDSRFILSSDAVVITRASATGPSLGVSLDGTYDLNTSELDMQGVISPVYFLNAIGQVFSRRGEGLFGFTFRLQGPKDNMRVFVNPLSILTPGMFREIFRKPPPDPTASAPAPTQNGGSGAGNGQ